VPVSSLLTLYRPAIDYLSSAQEPSDDGTSRFGK
jgi:hypothetical protein